MIESPVLQQLKAEWTCEAMQRAIVDFLVARFGAGAELLTAQLETINNESRLKELVRYAAVCPDLEAFQRRLSPAAD